MPACKSRRSLAPIIEKTLKKLLTILFLILTVTSCNKKKHAFYLVISELNKDRINDKNIIPNRFYYKHNFILTSDHKVFYYKPENYIECFPDCNEFDFSRPEYLGLLPSNIKQINYDSLTPLLQKIYNKKKYITVTIASENDTINNNALSIFIDFFNTTRQDSLKLGYSYRLMTEEESVVLNAKLKNIEYNPDSIKWKNKFGGPTLFLPNDSILNHYRR